MYTNSSMNQQSRLEEKVDIDRRYSTRNHIKNHSRIVTIEANMTAETSWLGLSKKGTSLECNRCSIPKVAEKSGEYLDTQACKNKVTTKKIHTS